MWGWGYVWGWVLSLMSTIYVCCMYKKETGQTLWPITFGSFWHLLSSTSAGWLKHPRSRVISGIYIRLPADNIFVKTYDAGFLLWQAMRRTADKQPFWWIFFDFETRGQIRGFLTSVQNLFIISLFCMLRAVHISFLWYQTDARFYMASRGTGSPWYQTNTLGFVKRYKNHH
jgi:hypothetical protein